MLEASVKLYIGVSSDINISHKKARFAVKFFSVYSDMSKAKTESKSLKLSLDG